MIHKRLGNTSEKLPAIGMGTWKLGANPADEASALKKGFKLGMNFVDTAEMYHSEHIVRMAISQEAGVFVATKVSPEHFRYDDVIKACDRSLKNLGLRTIDLYQLHWPNPGIPIGETMRAMEQLVKDGKIRHIGVSNFSVQEVQEAQAAMKSSKIVSNQVEYSVLARDIEHELMQFCIEEGITIIAYSPLAKGAIYRSGTRAYEILHTIAKKHNASVTQVALGWLASRPNVVAIPKAADPAHTAENAEAASLKLDEHDLKLIDSIESDYRPITDKFGKFKNHVSFFSGLIDKRERLRKFGI